MKTLIRRLIWVCTVCQLPFLGSLVYNGLKASEYQLAGIFQLCVIRGYFPACCSSFWDNIRHPILPRWFCLIIILSWIAVWHTHTEKVQNSHWNNKTKSQIHSQISFFLLFKLFQTRSSIDENSNRLYMVGYKMLTNLYNVCRPLSLPHNI